MEGSDVFAQDIGAGDDPFADGWDPANSEVGPGPGTESDSFEEEIPIVDREGAPVGPAHAPTDGASVESQAGERPAAPSPTQEAPAPAESAQEATPDPPPPAPAPDADAQAASGGEGGPLESIESAVVSGDSVKLDPQPVGTPADSTPSAPAEPTAAGEPPSDGASATEGLSSASNGGDAAPPTEAKGKRRYYILRVDGPGKFTQLFWYEDSKGKMVPKGTSGAKRQVVALARGADEALKVGFAAAGSPTDGITLVPIAALHFQTKKVKPAPPEPSRVRLQIS